jgi:creatinine amidohydrolase
MGQWNLEETTLGLSQEEAYEVAVLPIAATEAHGLHMPYATDTMQVDAIARDACAAADERGARVLLLPTVPFGVNENTLAFKWTISLRPSTLFRVVTDVVSCLEHHGIPKMLLLNGHGGNEFQPHLRELCRQTSVQVMLVNWYQCAPEAHARLFERPGEHADEMETSLMLHLRPELVRMDLAGDGGTREPRLTAMKEGWAWIARPWERFTMDSSFGDPSAASAEKGAEYIRAVTTKLADLLVEMSDAEVDELYPYRP